MECHDSDDDSSIMLYRCALVALVTGTSRTATGFLHVSAGCSVVSDSCEASNSQLAAVASLHPVPFQWLAAAAPAVVAKIPVKC